ncbi:MAG: SEC-C metal-binding domain-containing protein, partial [Blastocatellia bacterium]
MFIRDLCWCGSGDRFQISQ